MLNKERYPGRLLLCAAILSAMLAGCIRADEPSPAQIAWLKSSVLTFETAEAGHGFDDLPPLKELIGDARIVALGEGTHGTREFFQMKHRLVEYLASEMGFTIFSIEANMPEAYRVNDFVLTGEGDPKQLLKGMYFWTWNTQEVLDMILWIREFNKSGKGRIEFTGFDMQTPDVAMEIVLDFLKKADLAYRDKAHATYDATRTVNRSMAGGGSFGVATSTFPVEVAAGKRIRYSGYIKTEGATREWAGLWWRVDGESGALGFDNMQDRGPKGTTPWKRYEIELDVSPEATNINFGALHAGDGTAWFDGLQVEVDGKTYTNEKLFDLDFESETPRGFYTGGRGYEVELDSKAAYSGKQCLAMRFQGDDGVGNLGAEQAAKTCQNVLKHLESLREDYVKKLPPKEVDWAIQNARVVVQCFQMFAGQVRRDLCMARNVKWILDHSPADAKIVLWAHNGHVKRLPYCMGADLDRWYGDEMVVLGFAAREGRYTAMGGKGLGTHDLQSPRPGSVEHYFHASSLPRFILDLRKVSARSPDSAWLAKTRQFRSIGALAMEEQFQRTNVTKAFDALIYFDKTAASVSLPR